MKSGRAWFSECGTYRYALLRCIDLGLDGLDGSQGRCLNVVMLNPSTADATQDDPTIRRCIGYARRWGYGELMVTNLFGFRATEPAVMKAAADPIGPENDARILEIAQHASAVVVAWGIHGAHRGRDQQVLAMLHAADISPLCLGTTKGGQPKHPLYLSAGLSPVAFEQRQAVAP